MNDNTPQAAAERDGAILDAQLGKECARLSTTHADMLSKAMAKPALAIDEGTMGMQVGEVTPCVLPPVPHAILQTLIDGRWGNDVIDTVHDLEHEIKSATACRFPYRVILLHVESGNERADRERREKQEDMDRHREYPDAPELEPLD